MLFPRESETREVKDLSGIWQFRSDPAGEGEAHEWFEHALTGSQDMPVPSSFNDITQDKTLRDYVGQVWYEKEFYIPRNWKNKKVMIYFGSVTHHASVWVNGVRVAEHKGGFLPFSADISGHLIIMKPNRVTVRADNRLDWSCLPSGEVKEFNDAGHPAGFRIQEVFFDFFNYAGIHRPVRLCALPKDHIYDINFNTEFDGEDGVINYSVLHEGWEGLDTTVRILDREGQEIENNSGSEGMIMIPQAEIWQPSDPYLYTLVADLLNPENDLVDRYRIPVGIRTIAVEDGQLLLNGEPVYLRGFGRHEDSDIRGRGYDPVLLVKDFNLMKWMGANSFRTSHYPYAEEVLEMADKEGFLVINEVPAVGMQLWDERKVFCSERVNEETLKHHVQVCRDLIARDRHHPSVIMWSVANEANNKEQASRPYFSRVIDEVRFLDPTRPVTIVQCIQPEECRISDLVDVICVNRYRAWYSDAGHLELIGLQMEKELTDWYERFKKPVILTEFGADTVAGLHRDPAVMFSEEYQKEYLARHFAVLDSLDFIAGEHIWNFADFATSQGIKRIGSRNLKGLFTRQRDPKSAVFPVRERWLSMENNESGN